MDFWHALSSRLMTAWDLALRLALPKFSSQDDSLPNILSKSEYNPSPPPLDSPSKKRLMIGNTSETWLIGDIVRKTYVRSSDAAITKANIDAARKEACVYMILGQHPLIAKCLSVSSTKSSVDLRYYQEGSLRDYVLSHRGNITDSQLKTWARQLVSSVAYIHSKGVRHADLRLNQWLLDEDLQACLADFNGSGFDAQPELGFEQTPATGLESASHCLPRDFTQDSTVRTDLFALGSSLYELETSMTPHQGMEDAEIEEHFAKLSFPSVEQLLLGNIIAGCWQGQYASAEQILDHL
ncbi:hypothetical protein CDV31_014890 [Fusarium ambrosium]|uniref:Protein kinase domain-containing protein n=1 Tax=Fusarium ambrosium TaxID=131363 RepID=A0A428STE1_9HYPO|nr:hypothetical protein CDV31_014890 [Fusarium ambrosium]